MSMTKYKRGEKRKLTKNFDQSEFDCKGDRRCCSCGCKETKLDSKLVRKLQVLRGLLGKPIVINSGYRCATHNACQNGAKRSKHMEGRAADIRVSDGSVSPSALAKKAQELGFGCIGLYDDRIHVDTRPDVYYYDMTSGSQKALLTFGGVKQKCPHFLGKATLSIGSTGGSVKALQWIINWAGCKCGVDGVFGNKTAEALRRFQRDMGLVPDAVAGAKTLQAIREVAE